MTERNFFEKDTNFNSEASFSRIKYGIDKPILEVELNEMQKIQEEQRLSITRQTVPTGFLEKVKRDFSRTEILYNPTITIRQRTTSGAEDVTYVKKMNSIAIPPSKLIVNGYEVNIEGKEEIDGVKGYTVITLGRAPNKYVNSTEHFDFIFLEIWFEELSALSSIYKHGFVQGESLQNDIIDNRVGDETSRRVGLRHRIRVKEDVDLKKFRNGLGYNLDKSDLSRVYAQGPLNTFIEDQNYIFLPATDNEFKNTSFYNDFGLYVAGRKDYKDAYGRNKLNLQYRVLDDYIFAVPMFGVKRRNNQAYSLSNPSGGVAYVDNNSISDRPDGLFNNLVDSKDLLDLRKSISFGQTNVTKLLDENLKKLMTGELTTYSNDKMKRVQFGVPSIDSVSQDYLSDALLHLNFSNQSLLPKLGSTPTTNGGDVNYHLSALGYGLSLDGNLVVEYPLLSFNKYQGSIEFLLKPYWDGADKSISQTIFSITNENGFALIEFKKDKGELVLIQNYSESADVQPNKTKIDLSNHSMYNNETYHVRLSWLSNNSRNITTLFINGKRVVEGFYLPSSLNPKFLKLGSVENVNSYSPEFVGCLIDELVIYNKILDDNTFEQLSYDIKVDEAKIYNSFNGVLTGFQDNEHEQKIISVVSTINGENSFTLRSPYSTKLITDSAKVYSVLSGLEYTGEWTIINDSTVTFSLTESPENDTRFRGETLWVTHDIIVSDGLGIKDIPTKLLKAELNSVDISFANALSEKRKIDKVVLEELPQGYVEIIEVKGYDYSSSYRNNGSGFARVIECKVESNGTNAYKIPKTLCGREVLGIKNVNQPLQSVYKTRTGDFMVELLNELSFNNSFIIEIALGGFIFDYETHTKSLVSNMMKATTIKVRTTGSQRNYTIPATIALDNSNNVTPNGGIVVAFLDLKGQNQNAVETNFGTSVFITGERRNDFAQANVTGIGTPFININFEDTIVADHYIEIPVLVTYQPDSSEILSIWYEYSPYQGILEDNEEKKLRRFSDWKIFATTFGSGKVVTNNIKEKSINNAANRLPGGQNFSYLLDGKDINFVTEQMSISGNYSVNKKLIFRTQFTELVSNDEFDVFGNSLTTDFTIKKVYGKNYQDAFIESSISNIGFAIQDTWEPINKYLGAACLVIDEEGNVLLFVMGEIIKDPSVESLVRPIHGDLFKLENNPIIIPRND